MALKDTDSQKIALYLKTLPFAFLAAGIAFSAALANGLSVGKATAIFVVSFIIVMLGPVFFASRTADAVSTIYMSGGKSTPAPAQYSLADSLVARGQTDEAIEAYTLLSEDFPHDPEPRIRLARVLRDKKQDYPAAAEWFKKSFASEKMEPALEIAIIRELVEVYTHKMKTPERALPFLSRLSDKYPTHPAAEWAKREYSEIKGGVG